MTENPAKKENTLIEKAKENPYRECCGGVWSNFLQCYTGHYSDCKVWEREKRFDRVINDTWADTISKTLQTDKLAHDFARNVLKRYSEDERRISKTNLGDCLGTDNKSEGLRLSASSERREIRRTPTTFLEAEREIGRRIEKEQILKKIKERISVLQKRVNQAAGTVKSGSRDIVTYDRKAELLPTICDDVMNLPKHKKLLKDVDVCYADPAYDVSDFWKYQAEPFDKTKVIRLLGQIMKPGSFLCWLDLWYPMYSKKYWNIVGSIAVVVGGNTRVRSWFIWEHV